MAKARPWTEWLLLAVAAVTVLSGVVQSLAPGAALALMGLGASDETVFLFRLLSLVTALFGGALLHTGLTQRFEPTVLLWAAIQKFAGAAVLLLGVLSAVIAPGALAIAGYDFAAGLYIVWFYNRGGRS